ncbi:MAG: zinc-dependent alcohol dehydrogenase [Gaiellaceae bacterium]
MLAATFLGPREFRLEDLPDPVPGPGEAVVRVRSAGICGGDLHEYRTGAQLYPTPYPRPAQGHELAGTVTQVGAEVTHVAPGDRVAVQPMISCGVCDLCESGQRALCDELEHMGIARPGGFAELCLAPALNLFPLPPEVSDDEGALLDCTAVGVHALARVPVARGARVVVLGAGAIGLSVAQLARLEGGHVTVVATRPRPLEVALELGVDEVVDLGAGEEPPTDADIVFETAGGPTLVERALAAAGSGATIGLVGEAFGPQPLEPAAVLPRELTLAFVWSHDGGAEYARALELAAHGEVRLAPAVTHRYPLSELDRAFEAASDRARSDAIKVIVTP